MIQDALASGRTSIIIRNQPAGSVKLIRVDDINQVLVEVQPDGSVVTATDPNPTNVGTLNARFVGRGGQLPLEITEPDPNWVRQLCDRRFGIGAL